MSESASGIGVATIDARGQVLDTFYPRPRLGASEGMAPGTVRIDPATAASFGEERLAALAVPDPDRKVDRVLVATSIEDLEQPPADPTTPICGSTSSRTAWSVPTRSAWRASSGC